MTSVWPPDPESTPPRRGGPTEGSPADPTTAEHVASLLATGLDRYELRRLLGRGGMGEVYLGVHRAIEKEVAIKVLAYEHRHDPKLNERFLEEAKAASKIRHDHVVDITDFGHSPQGCAYFVMEYLEGEDLARTLRREGALPWARARHLLLQLLSALDMAHQHGIVHRDIKPANCLRTTRRGDPDFIKVLDFGIARVSGASRGTERLTKAGTIMGTAEYMAPEQARGEEVDPRTDIYAAGVMLFEMLTGSLPFDAATPVEMLSKHLFVPPPRVADVAPDADVPPQLDAIVARALAKDPADRWPSAAAMAEAIASVRASADGYAVSSEAATTAPPGAPSTSSPRTTPSSGPSPGATSSRGRVDVVAAALGILAVGGGLWWATRESDDALEPADAVVAAAAPTCPEGLALVAGGALFVGSDESDLALASARPTHKVELGAYCIGIHEVTVDQFHECSDRGQCRRPFKVSRWPDAPKQIREILSELCNENAADRGDHPVNCVTWEQAHDYCEFRGQRLPTEAEWELAARGSDGRVYPWGDAPPTRAHGNLCNAECQSWRSEHELPPEGVLTTSSDGWPGTAPIGSFPAGVTQNGLHDVVGNVFEWTATDFALYDGHPEGIDPGGGKVIRGGAFNSAYAVFSNPALRFGMDPAAHTHAIGFRCAADPETN